MTELTFDNFIDLPLSNAKAYLLGLLLPKIVISESKNNGDYYLLGQINHGYQNKPSEADILDHYINFKEFLNEYSITTKIQFNKELKSFSKNNLKFTGVRGIGFAVCFPIENSKKIKFNNLNINDLLYQEIRTLLINEAMKITEKEAPYFIAGTIDGRSSVDTTIKCVSLDVDSDNNLNDCLRYITEDKAKMDINLNDRTGRTDSTRMNQLRYKEMSVQDYYKKFKDILFSTFRKRKIEEIII